MGVKPSQVADLLALKGDSIDNIPGAPGIGDKGARDLITRFGSVENALDHANEVERKMYRESLLNNRDQILLSKKLATIDTTVPIDCDVTTLVAAEPMLWRCGAFIKSWSSPACCARSVPLTIRTRAIIKRSRPP